MKPELFEQLLAAYPAEKRELARQVYCRFAEGDSTQFFTQLFIVLELYAHYAERIPEAVVAANGNATAHWRGLREQMDEMGKALERRNLNIANHADATEELCTKALAKCAETVAKLEAMPKDIGARVDVKSIVDGIRERLELRIQGEIIGPFLKRSEALSKEVLPTLKTLKEVSAEAHETWTKNIWRIAWTGTSLVSGTLVCIAIMILYLWFGSRAEQATAAAIHQVNGVMNSNREAFVELAIARAGIRILRTRDAKGALDPSGYVLILDGADSAEVRTIQGQKQGMIFFTSSLRDRSLQEITKELERLATPPNARK